MSSGTGWDPQRYLDFDDHRARPFTDLLARVGATSPRHVVDAGCGPGHLTAAVAARWPEARVTAFDASPEMVAAARERGVAARRLDVWAFDPAAEDADVVVCNAVLHWVPDHRDLLRRWVAALPAGGWLAAQLPGNAGSPAHRLAAEEAARYQVDLAGAETVVDPITYADDLDTAGAAAVDAWETTYLHRLTGDDPVLRWIASTTLRPVRDVLDDDGWSAFTGALAPRLRAAYPPSRDGSTWFPFRRIFVVSRV